MHQPDEATRSRESIVTVLFSDITDFSGLAETMSAPAVAALLNRHFELVSTCIEAEGGTVDKFIGDSVMAFWGAPEEMADHAAHAVKTAAAIRRATRRDNAARAAASEPAIAVRLGLHLGAVVVGNIGSASRVNYTVVGDTVNTASRLEQLGKELAPDDDCVVLLSGELYEALPATARAAHTFIDLGAHPIRGRAGEVRVYRLVDDED